MSTRVKVDFLVPGFSKCGTTTLCAQLERHPGIFIPRVKEPWYFSSRDFAAQHHHYDHHFQAAGAQQKLGEGSTSYSGAEREDIAIARIHANNPDCRFIFIARNPRHRVESSYREMHHSGVQFGLNAPFALGECMTVFPQMCADSSYWERINKYRVKFGDDSILVVLLEELNANPQRELERCFAHIGVDPLACPPPDQALALNSGDAKLYDSALLRGLRTTPILGPAIAKLGPFEQDRLFVRCGLRRPFGDRAVVWDARAQDLLEQQILPDARQFLRFYHKPAGLWDLAEGSAL